MYELGLPQLLHTIGRLHLTHSVCMGQVSVGAFIWGGFITCKEDQKSGLGNGFQRGKFQFFIFFFTFFYDEDVEHGVVVPKEEGSFCSPSPATSLPSGSVLPGSRGCSRAVLL